MIFDFLFENYIDKVFVFFDSQGSKIAPKIVTTASKPI